MTKVSIAEFAERVRAATGPDREIDCLIRAIVVEARTVWVSDTNQVLARNSRPPHDVYLVGTIDPGKHSRNFWPADSKPSVPDYTASTDAALALVERRLKTYSLEISIDPSGNGAKLTWWPNGLSNLYDTIESEGASETPELAVLLALLNALTSLGETNEQG